MTEREPPTSGQRTAQELTQALAALRDEVQQLRECLTPSPPPGDYVPGRTLLWDHAPAPAPAPAEPAAAEAEPQVEQGRVVLQGEVLTVPGYFRTRRGKPMAKFVLGVADADHVQSYTVLAFDKRVELVRQKVRIGATVQCIGYRHRRDVTRADGSVYTAEEIHLAAVTTPKSA